MLFVWLIFTLSALMTTKADEINEFDSVTMPGPVLYGGREKLSSDSEMMQTLISYANDHYYNATNFNESIWIVKNIENVTQQLVAGMIYRFDAILTKTKCFKGELDNETNETKADFGKKYDLCMVGSQETKPENNHKVVHYEILSKPWLDILEVMLMSSSEEIQGDDNSLKKEETKNNEN